MSSFYEVHGQGNLAFPVKVQCKEHYDISTGMVHVCAHLDLTLDNVVDLTIEVKMEEEEEEEAPPPVHTVTIDRRRYRGFFDDESDDPSDESSTLSSIYSDGSGPPYPMPMDLLPWRPGGMFINWEERGVYRLPDTVEYDLDDEMSVVSRITTPNIKFHPGAPHDSEP